MAYTTRKTLLQVVLKGDESSWAQFQAFYKPLIRLCGHDFGLTEEEIQDLQQEVLIEVNNADVIGKYKQSRGRFRDYLRTIIRRKAFRIRKQRLCLIEQLPASNDNTELETAWKKEWLELLLKVATNELKEKVNSTNFMAYDLNVDQNIPAPQVAAMLKITLNQVYLAKGRCSRLLAEIINKLKNDDSL
ncbi:MAG: sigma-70 family RNA polymerase sigma factor [Victivallales bacterium]|nr:sigma-70 family RNA polymerase sigma factor [Victivallales bacterium]